MRVLLVVTISLLCSATAWGPLPAARADERNIFDDPTPPGWTQPASNAVPCASDIYCGAFHIDPDVSWWADGEWNPSTNQIGWVSTAGTVGITDPLCAWAGLPVIVPNYSDPNGEVTRGFCWGVDPSVGDFWVGSWDVAPNTPNLIHVDATGTVLAEYSYVDPAGGNMQFAGMAMDYANGHLWAFLRNAAGGATRAVEFNANVDPPTILQGPLEVPWLDGPDSNGRAGLEYNNLNCTIVALRQRPSVVGGIALLALFQDQNPGGAGGISALADCELACPEACQGSGQGTNAPWGIAVVEDPAATYAMFSDLSAGANCAAQAEGALCDLHLLLDLPVTSAQCLTAVEPTTWGQIKSRYSN